MEERAKILETLKGVTMRLSAVVTHLIDSQTRRKVVHKGFEKRARPLLVAHCSLLIVGSEGPDSPRRQALKWRTLPVPDTTFDRGSCTTAATDTTMSRVLQRASNDPLYHSAGLPSYPRASPHVAATHDRPRDRLSFRRPAPCPYPFRRLGREMSDQDRKMAVTLRATACRMRRSPRAGNRRASEKRQAFFRENCPSILAHTALGSVR